MPQAVPEKTSPYQIEISRPELADLPTVLAMWKQQHDLHLALDPNYYTVDSPQLDRDAEEYFREAIENDNPHIRIAKLQRQTVGFVTYEKSSPVPGIATSGSKVAHHVEVVDLFVEEPARNKNVGQQLMTAAIDFAKQQGIKSVVVEVSSHNPAAQRFYERMGFAPEQVKSYLEV